MSDYHARIMNIPTDEAVTAKYPPEGVSLRAYKTGHRDARLAAAVIALEAEAEVERLLGELVDATELLGYRDRDIEKFRKGILAFTAEVARLQARERELEARLRMTQSVLWDDDGADLGCATAWREALLRSRKLMDAALAAVSAETEGSDG